MKIAEARQIYGTQIKAYQEQRLLLSIQKKELAQKMAAHEDGQTVFAEEAAVLELTLDAVDKKQREYQDYMEKLTEQWAMQANALVAKQQGEAMEDYVEDLGKIMEVARRIMKGGIVPAADEKKLMEYSIELYQAAKNMGALARQKNKEKYDSLWEDEEEKEYADPLEEADNAEAFAEGPDVVDVADTVAASSGDM